jgi:hypothetical protein
VLFGAEGDDNVGWLGDQLDLQAQRASLLGEADRREGALANDHRVHELDRNMSHVRAGRRRAAKGDQPSTARKALGQPVAEASGTVGFGLEETPVGDRAALEQLLDAPGGGAG